VTVNADIHADLLKFDYEPCEEIYSHHFFEHLNYYEALGMMIKWTLALKPGGVLYIGVPDMRRLCAQYLEACGSRDFPKMLAVTRLMCGSAEGTWAYHINMWSHNSLNSLLVKFGYRLGNHEKLVEGPFAAGTFNSSTEVSVIKSMEYSASDLLATADDILAMYCKLPSEQKLYDYFKMKLREIVG